VPSSGGGSGGAISFSPLQKSLAPDRAGQAKSCLASYQTGSTFFLARFYLVFVFHFIRNGFGL
jgi:hypothetical protein